MDTFNLGNKKYKEFIINNKDYFRIKVTKVSNPSWENQHFHNKYEIWYPLFGKTACFIQDRMYEVEKGNILIINKNILHRIGINKSKKMCN